MSPLRAEFSRFSGRTARWLFATTLLAVAPKCVLCAMAYLGVGSALGIGGAEWCGATTVSPAAWATALAWCGVVAAPGTCGILAVGRRRLLAPR